MHVNSGVNKAKKKKHILHITYLYRILIKVTFPFGYFHFVRNLLRKSAQNLKLRYMDMLLY